MILSFEHRQSAHCETGVAANLLAHYGVAMDEALAFGIGSGLFFGYLPFIRLNHLPLTTYRIATGGILRRLTRRLGVAFDMRRYHRPQAAMDALDRKLDEGVPVGCQTGGYWLPYFPQAYRFHFNMHNLVVYGREGGDYLISDPIFEQPVRCARADLLKARFAQGPLAPKGKMYFVTGVPAAIDWPAALFAGMREVGRTMLKAPGGLVGVSGMGRLARAVEGWPARLGEERARLYLGQVIRMQEEIGTGGAGFRFIYAAFLQKAADLLGDPRLMDLAAEMTAIGDRWRAFAVAAARNCKGRAREGDSYAAMAAIVRECAAREAAVYERLLAFAPAGGLRARLLRVLGRAPRVDARDASVRSRQ
jgi:hypothetical protein